MPKPSKPTKRPAAKRASVADRVRNLAINLWWTWNPSAQNLFASLDPLLWDATHRNPIRTLKLLAAERKELIETDPAFAAHLESVESELASYLAGKTWFERTFKSKASRKPLIAYFCAEFAIHESLPQYSGGLGVLAGDHVKSASDLGLPFVGVGLLYRNGYYTQEFAPDGTTRVVYPRIDFDECPISDTGKTIEVPMVRRKIVAKLWKQTVGRVHLILLDTDVAENSAEDRKLTQHLYGGDREYRIQQEMLLGVGGVMALEAMNLKPTVFHMNEGHAAFAALHRVRQLRKANRSLENAKKEVRAASVFTTHTPVPAGNDRFTPQLAWKYLSPLAGDLGVTKEELLGLGRENPSDHSEEFCMTVLALRLSQRCNGVAALHGETSRKMWTRVYQTRNPDQVPIGHVTNGIHSQTWLAPEMRPLYDKYLKPRWSTSSADDDCWKNAGKIPAVEFWLARNLLRSKLVRFVRSRLVQQLTRQHASLDQVADAQRALDDNTLTIGFARRFATYKRAPLIFRDAKRLARIVGDSKRPVQILFAGKAHPADKSGQDFARQIHAFSQLPQFKNRVVILEDYDMELGRMLTSGCDVWLNNPLRPQEASGTSGMKPPLHGGINCSILDGWWPEAFNGKNGWSIGDETELPDQKKQDDRDANSIYTLLEKQIAPEFYQRDGKNVPTKWVARMAESMRTVCGQFSTSRMVGEYCRRFYMPAHG